MLYFTLFANMSVDPFNLTTRKVLNNSSLLWFIPCFEIVKTYKIRNIHLSNFLSFSNVAGKTIKWYPTWTPDRQLHCNSFLSSTWSLWEQIAEVFTSEVSDRKPFEQNHMLFFVSSPWRPFFKQICCYSPLEFSSGLCLTSCKIQRSSTPKKREKHK